MVTSAQKAVSASHALSWEPGLLNLHQLTSIPMQALADAKVSTEEIAAIEVIGGSSRVPALIKILKDFFAKEPSRTLNAKECVSRGCALNCAMLSPIFRCVMPIAWLVEDASLSQSGVKLSSSFAAFCQQSCIPALLCCLSAQVCLVHQHLLLPSSIILLLLIRRAVASSSRAHSLGPCSCSDP